MTLFDDFNVAPEDATWESFAICRGLDNIDPNLFYDTYENDVFIAKNIDIMCSRCPVMKACHNTARANKECGVWGGTYWLDGKRDRVRNKHKTAQIVKILQDRVE